MEASAAAWWRAWLLPALALLLLNASLTFENVWPTPAVTWGLAVSAELAVAVLLISCVPSSGLTRWLLPAVWVALVAGRYVAVTAPGLYGRELNLYWDSQHLGNVAAMLSRALDGWAIVLALAVSALAVAAAFVLARAAFGALSGAMATRGSRRALRALSAAVVALFVCQQAVAGFPAVAPFAAPVTAAYARQVRYAAGMIGPGAVAPALAASPAFDASLERVRDADVLLVFVESYGAVTFEDPDVSAGLKAGRDSLAEAIAETGREAVSAYVESPTFGGSSWLAHLSLISGVEVRDQYAYTSLMASRRETMLAAFERQGFRTVALMPGMRQAWPEGAFYGFDAIYSSSLLAYQGPQFGWWSIPDQYALARLDALERTRAPRAPIFAVFPTSTTHAPFGPVPPYQPEWQRILTGTPFDTPDVERTMALQPDLLNLRPDYVRAMLYEYRTFAGYLREHADDDLMMVLVGDHQPPAAVAGRDASWSVPVHVITRNRDVAASLIARGFTAGIVPGRPSIARMPALVPMLLESFSGDSAPETPDRES